MRKYLETENLTLCLAELSDLDLACDLRRECMCAVFGGDVDECLPELMERNRVALERGFTDDTCMMIVAYRDGEVAGCGVLFLSDELPSLDNPSGINAILMNIYTRPQYRRMGVGTTVTKALIELAHRMCADKIILDATAAGAPIYRSLGFVDYEGCMVLGGVKTR